MPLTSVLSITRPEEYKGEIYELFVLALIALVSINVNASQLPESATTPATLVKKVQMRGNLMPGPGVRRPVLTTVTFVVSTCRKVTADDFKLTVKNRPGVMGRNQATLLLGYKNGVFADCFGPARETEIVLVSREIPANSSVVLGNPLLVRTQFVH